MEIKTNKESTSHSGYGHSRYCSKKEVFVIKELSTPILKLLKERVKPKEKQEKLKNT